MVRYEQVSVTLDGVTGSVKTSPITGKIEAIHIAYEAGTNATTDVTIATTGATPPAQTILTVTNNATSGWYYPRVPLMDAAGATVTYDGTNEIYDKFAITDSVTVSIAQSTTAKTITVTIIYEV